MDSCRKYYVPELSAERSFRWDKFFEGSSRDDQTHSHTWPHQLRICLFGSYPVARHTTCTVDPTFGRLCQWAEITSVVVLLLLLGAKYAWFDFGCSSCVGSTHLAPWTVSEWPQQTIFFTGLEDSHVCNSGPPGSGFGTGTDQWPSRFHHGRCHENVQP